MRLFHEPERIGSVIIDCDSLKWETLPLAPSGICGLIQRISSCLTVKTFGTARRVVRLVLALALLSRSDVLCAELTHHTPDEFLEAYSRALETLEGRFASFSAHVHHSRFNYEFDATYYKKGPAFQSIGVYSDHKRPPEYPKALVRSESSVVVFELGQQTTCPGSP